MCTGMDYDYWEPYWKNHYGTKPMMGYIQDSVTKEIGKPLSQATKAEIHEALRKLGFESLIEREDS